MKLARFLLLGSLLLLGLIGPGLSTGSAKDLIYTAKRGDTLSGVAKKYGMGVSELASRNGLKPTALLSIGQKLSIPAGTAAQADSTPQDLTYTVRRGDTLSGVAERYGVSVSALASRNGIKPNGLLSIGQRLIIPGGNRSPEGRGEAGLDAAIRQAIASAPVRTGRWKRIVIHHSGTTQASIKGMIDHHSRVRHMENGLAYHFVVGNGKGMPDGSVYVGNRWKRQLDGGHLASQAQNRTSLGICLVGNFDQQKPTPKQLASLEALLRALRTRCRLSTKAIVTHQDINVLPTRCPGKHFPMKTVLRSLNN